MSNTAITITLSETDKTAVITGDTIAIRETITVTLANTGSLSSADLQLGIVEKGVLIGSITTFTDFVGTLDLNKTEIISYYGNMSGRSTRTFNFAIWDLTNDNLVTLSTIEILNNPYEEGMTEPTDVTPISGATAETFTTALKNKLDAIENLADVTDATNVNAAGAVMESDFNANTILAATADNTPATVTVAEQTVIGRLTAENIKALSVAELQTLINIEDGADVTDTTNVNASGAVMETDFNAGTFLYATSDNTPEAKTVAEVNALLGFDNAAYVTKTLYDANTILYATSDNTPAALTITEQTIVGRKTGGNITALTATEIRTLINVEDGSTADMSDAQIKTAYENNADTNAYTDAEKTKLGYLTLTAATSLDAIKVKTDLITISGAANIDSISSNASTGASHAAVTGTNPHAVTASNVSLGNVTNNAQMKKISSNTDSNIPQWDGTTGDLLKDGLGLQTTISDVDTSVPSSGAVIDYVATVKLDDMATPDDNTDLNATSGRHGLLPKLSNVVTQFLNGQGGWTTPPDSGDVSGPATNTDAYIPQWDGTDSKLLKDGLLLQTTITDTDTAIPTSGAIVDIIAATKIDNLAAGEDNTDLDSSATRHGLLPKLSGTATDVLLGDGTWGSGVTLPTASAIGDMVYYATGAWTKLDAGTDEYVLRANGSGSAVSWQKIRYELEFDDEDLDANGEITVTHNLNQQYVHVIIVDNNNKLIDEAEEITFDSTTALTLKMEAFQPLSGTWKIICSW